MNKQPQRLPKGHHTMSQTRKDGKKSNYIASAYTGLHHTMQYLRRIFVKAHSIHSRILTVSPRHVLY